MYPRDNQQLRTGGQNGDVLEIKQTVEQELVINFNISENFRLTGTKARCFQQLYLKDITDLKDVMRRSSGEYKEIKASDEAYIISVSGEQTKVRYVLSELDKLARKIWHETIILHKDVAKPKDLEILIGGLQRSDLKKFQATFEVQHSCFLTIHLPNTSSYKSVRTTPPLDSLRSPSMPVFPRQDEPEVVEIFPERHREQKILTSKEAPSRFFQEREPPRRILNNITVSQTNCKIMIHTSDITKQKMDILVNVVSSSQNIKSTRISQAFEKTGGPAFVQGYEGAKAMSVGSVIASSPAGNLNCSQVLTIVLNPCDPANQDASKMQLKKAINDCFALADTAKATSIAFPPVGCGVLFKYPPKFVAASFISAAKNAAKKGILQDIGFFIMDKQVYNIFLDEINPHKTYGGPHPHVSAHNFMMFPEQEGLASGDNTSIQIGSATIQVLQGDITKHKASVLVNVITEDHDLRKTALSQAFLRSGGASLNQDFQQVTSSGEIKRIYITKGYDLNCDYVFHVVVKKFDNSNAESSRQELIATVEDCFKVAQTYNTKSIALPAIGTGVLFKFSPSFVATCLVSAAKDAARYSTSLKNISFVIYDQDIYFTVVKELTSASPGTTDVYSKFTASLKKCTPSERAQTSKITIEAKTQDICMSAKKALIKDLQSSFLYTEFVENDSITKLPSSRCSELAKMADENGVYIKFPNAGSFKPHKKNQLKLKGEKNVVTAIKIRVQEILLNEMSKERKENTEKYVKPGTNEFIKMMATTSDHNTPKYWTYFTPDTKVSKLLISTIGTTKKDWSLQDIPANEDIYKAVSDLVVKTWKQNLVGHGKDALNLTTGHKLKIVKIQRLENIELFRRYCQNRARLFVKAAKKPITPIRKLPDSNCEVETTAAAAPSLRQDIYVNEVNEHYLFHGTKMDTIDVVCGNGLDSRVSSTMAMFGSGIYAAESSTKADQYADDKYNRQPNGTNLCMILLRMALGEPFLTSNKNSPKYRLPPCKGSGCHKDGCTTHSETFDSVIGHGSWLFREFVVYERDLVYPEYFIIYQRV